MPSPEVGNPCTADAAYIDGRYMPIGQAAIPITDRGYRHSDVTYNVVGVWEANVFRLDDHIAGFRTSMRELRLEPAETDDDIRAILNCCVALSQLRRVVTPDADVLEGVTRRTVLELCNERGVPREVGRVAAKEARDADEIFLSTTAGGVMPASRIDGRIMNNDSPGPVSAKIKDTFWDKRAAGRHATPVDHGDLAP